MSIVKGDESAAGSTTLPAAPAEVIEWIKGVEDRARAFEPLKVKTDHHLHAGLYARTVHLPPMGLFTNVVIKIPTLLVVSGDCWMLAGDRWAKLTGYQVIEASAGRKQICITKEATDVTMLFATAATTVEEAEAEFTDEAAALCQG